MAKDYAKWFYNSKPWLDCRKGYIASVHGLCEHCLKKDIYTSGYIVDHIVEIEPENINDVGITLSWDNLQYLCLACHNRKTFGNGEEVIGEGLRFDSKGELVRDG